jgi:hypothetical protein
LKLFSQQLIRNYFLITDWKGFEMGHYKDSIITLFDNLCAGEPALALGPPGAGKSGMAKSGGELHRMLADHFGVDRSKYGYASITPAQSEVTEVTGIRFPNQETLKLDRYMPNTLPTDPESYGLVVIEEITNVKGSWVTALYEFLMDRSFGDGEYQLPPGWSILATGNRVEDGCGSGAMSNAMLDRLGDVEILPCQKDWESWAIPAGVDYRVIAATRWHPDFVEAFDGKVRTKQSTPRSLAKFARIFENSGLVPGGGKSEVDKRIYRMAKSRLGEEDGGRMSAFMSVFSRLPDIDAILTGVSESVPVPMEFDVQVASMAQLAKMSDRDNIGNILRWIDRNSDTMKVVFGIDIETAESNASARNTVEFRDWRIANDNLFE